MNFTKFVILFASFLGLSGLILDAIGAHALRHWLSESQHIDSVLVSWQTAVRSQILHALLLLILISLFGKFDSSLKIACALCLFFGVALFSGSIYLKTLSSLQWATKLAPTGGILLMLGWFLIGAHVFFKNSHAP